MGRVLFFALVDVGAWAVLKALWPQVRTRRAFVAFCVLAVLGLLGWLLPVALGMGLHGTVPVVGGPLKFFGAVWIVTALFLVVFGSLFLFLRWLGDGVRRRVRGAAATEQVQEEVDLARRRWLGGVGRAVPFAAVATSAGGVAEGMSGFTVRHEEVRLQGLPQALDGFRIGQITDVHVGAFIDSAYVRRCVEAMNEAGAHLQVMTGDLIDDLAQLEPTMRALEECRAPLGMLAILGNHEYYRGLPEVEAAYEASRQRSGKVRLLVDESLVVEHQGAPVRVVGVDYPMALPLGGVGGGREESMRRSAEAAFQGIAPGETVLCLSHHPDFFPFASERGARLTLSGHTHGGQVAFFGLSAFWFAFKHMLGRYRDGANHLYVSGGTGHWLPFRVGVPAEVTIVTLRAA